MPFLIQMNICFYIFTYTPSKFLNTLLMFLVSRNLLMWVQNTLSFCPPPFLKLWSIFINVKWKTEIIQNHFLAKFLSCTIIWILIIRIESRQSKIKWYRHIDVYIICFSIYDFFQNLGFSLWLLEFKSIALYLIAQKNKISKCFTFKHLFD